MAVAFILFCTLLQVTPPPESKWEPPAAVKAASLAESTQAAPKDLLTRSEISEYRETGVYAESVEFARKLEKRSPWVRVQTIGRTPQGRDMILIVISKDRAFTPEAARKTGKAVVFIQNGIHSGEIAGKDASLMLLRDVVINKRFANWLDHTILLVLPVFNIDGHEKRSPYNRMNQNGPLEMGWRTTAQRINLNRDYVKADAPEMRAFIKAYTAWLPELLIDNHVTDGADYQYDMTLGVPTEQEIWPNVGTWSRRMLKDTMAALERDGHVVARYAEPVDYTDVRKGLEAGGAPPRFSTGYAAAQNRASILVETHSLKRYKTRLWAHYDLMRRAIEFVARDANSFRQACLDADREVAGLAGKRLFVAGESSKQADPFVYRGLAANIVKSNVTGGEYPVYTATPQNTSLPLYQKLIPTLETLVPSAYAVPREWTPVLELLALHGVRTEPLTTNRRATVETVRFQDVKWAERPYESRHRLSFKTSVERESATLQPGMVLVPMNQRAARIAVHILEPEAPDSALRWGLFDTIFEQKEYAEPYLMEPLAARMLASDERLRAEYEARVRNDPQFAANPAARRQFLYERSPYWDRDKDRYPVLRVISFE